ncbi:MAG: B12-binding domain-containing radical SAM protein [Magnetococcales bacterium]|nr:B12-binding domain-containing radical SAM protein [Magnetococcales bacterium]
MATLTFVTYLTRDMEMMPVGPLTLATLARERGWEVAVTDLPAFAEEESLAHRLAEQDVVGFSTLCSTFHRSLRLAARVKTLNPGVIVAMGGPQASAVASLLMQRRPCVDLVFRGEAEAGWADFLDGLPWWEIPGVTCRRDGGIVETLPAPLLMDLDRLPLPAFDLYPPSGMTVPLETGRGCPFACAYCSTNHHFSRRYRVKSPQRILAEMDLLHDLHGVRAFDLIDDSFTANRRGIGAFRDAMAGHHRTYFWNISARPDQVDANLAQSLRSAGCRGIFLGIETGSERMQKVVRKHLRLERAVRNITAVRQAWLATTVSFIIGFPGETQEDLLATLRLFCRLATMREMVLQLHLLSPLAGSELIAAGARLAYDGMPTDFNELMDPVADDEREQYRLESDLFPHMHYFADTQLPRARYLFLAYVTRLCGWYFCNFLHLACRWCPEAWLDYLLTVPVPEEMVGDASFPEPMALWSERVHAVCLGFAKEAAEPGLRAALAYDRAYSRVSHLPEEPPVAVELPRGLTGRNPGRLLPALTREDFADLAGFLVCRDDAGMVDLVPQLDHAGLEAHVREICAPCGECCLDEDGVMCGQEEWAQIARFLEQHRQRVPGTTPTAWRGLVLEEGTRYLARPFEGASTLHETHAAAQAAAGEHGLVRHACIHLALTPEGFGCGIHEVKPAECLAYPLRPMGDGGREWHLEAMEARPGERCPLARQLRERPMLGRQYVAWLQSRLEGRAGAVALGRMHAGQEDERERRA